MAHGVISQIIFTPEKGVKLGKGILKEVHDNNIKYLKGLSTDSILYWFRIKAGLPAPGEPYRGHFEDNIKGQTAGLFLMGAANSLKWKEDVELRRRVNEIIDCIETSKEHDGFFEPISKSEFGTKEYPNYVRVWLNYGLSASHKAGNEKALPLMRGMQSWFNQCDERVIAKDLILGFQGVVANTTVYFTDIGIQDDLNVTVDYYQENWWLAQFIRGDDNAVHKRPTPHGTELEAITAYMDMYIATGKPLYINAVNGAYRMFKKNWQHIGGGIVAIEHTDIEPGCNSLDPVNKYNELCCTAHWIYLNQKYHWLFPDEEKYVNEIEKSIYNIAVANQVDQEHIRYHAFLDIQKDDDRSTPVSCCAGLGTRIFGSLPEFLYSIAPDGLYVDIYASSEITWKCDNTTVKVSTQTDQPTGSDVRIELAVSAPKRFILRLRIPSWVTAEVAISLNGENIETGTPGSYCAIDRTWSDGDKLSFTLSMGLHVTRYSGRDSVPGFNRYAIEYGPLLLGVVGNINFRGRYIKITQNPIDPSSWLEKVPGKPSQFMVKNMPGYKYMPYYKIRDQVFTCYPIMQKK